MSDEMEQHDAPCQWERLEAVAMQLVLRTLLPYRFRSAAGA
jgi:hypothetical protein